MKKGIVLFTVFISIIMGSVVNAQEVEYIGDFCWQEDGDLYKLGFTHMGGGHFSVNGVFMPDDPDPNEGPYILHGAMEIINGEIHINLTSETEYDPNAAGIVSVFVQINPTTLNGTYKAIDINVEESDQNIETFSGSLTYVSCP